MKLKGMRNMTRTKNIGMENIEGVEDTCGVLFYTDANLAP